MNARPSVRDRFVRRCSTLAGRYSPDLASASAVVLDSIALAVPGLSAKVAAILVRMLRRKLARTAQEV